MIDQEKEQSNITSARNKNRLLAALSQEEFEQLLPELEAVSFKMKETIYKPDEAIECVFFPLSGIFSLVTILQDGAGWISVISGERLSTGILWWRWSIASAFGRDLQRSNFSV